jgi:carboxymethylenebutenolidase
MFAIEPSSAAAKIDAAIVYASRSGPPVALMGFSMGAQYALDASVRHGPDVAATVTFYGGELTEAEDARYLTAVLSIYGSKDGDAAERAAKLSRLTDDAGSAAEIYIYPGAAHAFAQPLFNGGDTFDAAAARMAWALTENFLERRLFPR